MSMDIVANAQMFWQIVELSLVQFYGWESAAAHSRVLNLRGKMTKAAIAQDVTYHSEPLNVAGDIARNLEPVSDTVWNDYQDLVRRVTAEWTLNSTPVEEPASLRQAASRKTHPVAALSR